MACIAEKRPVLYAQTGRSIIVYQPACKSWQCPECAKVKRAEWRERIGLGIKQYHSQGVCDWSFVLLTSNRKWKTQEVCIERWPDAWKKLSTRIKREYGNVHYAALPELHESGLLHMHLIIGHWSDAPKGRAKWGKIARWYKKNAAECGLGWFANSKPCCDYLAAARYATKYMTKSMVLNGWPENLRRVRVSAGWPEVCHGESAYDWEYWGQYYPDGLQYVCWDLANRTGLPTMVNGQPGTTVYPD